VNPEQKIRRYLETTADRVGAARRLVAAGQMIDLSGLETEVDGVCRAIRELAPRAQKDFTSPLVRLVDELDKLAADLRAQYERVQRGLRTISTGGQAAARSS